MRNWFFVLLLALAGAGGYAVSPRAVQADPDAWAFSFGQTVLLTWEDGRRQQQCTVVRQRGDFLACGGQRSDPGVWYNLRFIERVEEVPGSR